MYPLYTVQATNLDLHTKPDQNHSLAIYRDYTYIQTHYFLHMRGRNKRNSPALPHATAAALGCAHRACGMVSLPLVSAPVKLHKMWLSWPSVVYPPPCLATHTHQHRIVYSGRLACPPAPPTSQQRASQRRGGGATRAARRGYVLAIQGILHARRRHGVHADAPTHAHNDTTQSHHSARRG